MFSTTSSAIPLVIGFGVPALAIVAILFRPLLLSSVSAELGAVRGVRVRLAGLLCMIAIALAVSLSAITVGAILSTALLIGPAAIALRLTNTPGRATIAAALIALGATWIGIVLAYDSFYWPPAGHGGWPVSFFIVTLIFVGYLVAQLFGRRPARVSRAEG
jgi:zinc/manganese transport system permease protein